MKTTYQYVLDLQDRLEKTCQLAQEQLRKASGRYRKYYNKQTKDRRFDVGTQVLVLLPMSRNKLLLQWRGPFEVKQVLKDVDYRIDIAGKLRIFHANILKQYQSRKEQDDRGVLTVVSVTVVSDEEDEDEMRVV